MEGVVVLSNNKPLLTTRFSNPRLADLSIDAFLNAKRSRTSSSHAITYNDVDAYDTVTSGSSSNGKSRDDVIDPIIWFEAFEDLSRRRGHASTSQNGGMGKGKGKARGRLNSYTVSDDEDEETDSEEEEDSEDDDDDEDEDVATGNAWASTSSARTDEKTNGSTKTSSKIGTSYGCCHISHNNLSFLVPVRRDCDPSIAFSYLYSLIGVLRQYLGGEVNDTSLKENFDVTLQLLEETFSAPYPVSTDASALQELVPTSSLFSKMLMAGLAAATQATSSVSGLSSSSNHHQAGFGSSGMSGSMTPSSLFSSPLYWRRSGIKYAQNEIFFDINEEIKAVIDKNGSVINGDVWGRIDCRCKLSGMPDVSISLSNAAAIDDPSFHPCVRIGKWTAGKSLSFVPPDGGFELMGYRLSNSSPGSLYRASNASGKSSDTLPLRIRPVITTGEAGGSFNISLAPSGTVGPGGVAILEDVTVELYLGSSATAVKGSIQSNDNRRLAAISSSGSTGSSQANKVPPGGSWAFDTITRVLTWKIPKLVSSPVLSGTWQYDDNLGKSDPSPVMSVRFKAPLTNVSGLSITSLKVLGEKYSMYKGLRSNMRGHVEVRW
ncbi:clathrin adaptor, mu subunit [Cystobasidium minutum MCA 4210]|uniref:clathrin adaptor, mu subunit n=1 Tax=Cystobasidium minutum MCA 4210 TaxID=1397322 RepID=UPI0034CE6578|eukprot:jgi/Rhomi1/195873/gm1.4087_g